MFVLHGLWSPGRLTVWGEDSEQTVTSTSQALRSARPHPFAVGSQTLAALAPGTPTETVLLLPSLAKSPLDSPELVRITPRAARRADPTLLAWQVPSLELPLADTFAWLRSLTTGEDERESSAEDENAAGGENTAEGEDAAAGRRLSPWRAGVDLRLGASLLHLADLAAFADELAERRRVLPTVRLLEDGPEARWRPALQGPDVVAVGELVTAMPPVCRATPDAPSAYDITMDALHALTDTAMRARLRDLPALVPPRRGRRPRMLPALEGWLTALTAADGAFTAQDDEVAALALQLRAWDEIGTGRVGPARATFRLSEAAEVDGLTEMDGLTESYGLAGVAGVAGAAGAVTLGGPGGTGASGAPTADEASSGPWRVEFLLQSTLDPSLLVPAAQAWADDGSLRRWLERPQELLLGELGRASKIYPELVGGLRQATPVGLDLDAEGAHHFLSVAAPALDEAGFGVLLPTWWDRRRRLGLKASAMTPTDAAVTGGTFSRESLMDFRWQLAIGDDTLTEDEILALAQTKAPLVRLRGQWVAVDPEHLRRGLEFLGSQPTRQRTAAEILALAASHPDDLGTPLPVTSVSADGWLGELLAGTAATSLNAIDPPESFLAALRPYQSRGLSWLSFLSSLGLGACLADDMGLGKTVQLLALEATQRAADPQTGPTLLVCPMSLVGNWEREAARFAPQLRVHAHHGRDRFKGEALGELLTTADLVVTTYATATRDIDDLAEHDWHRIVLDEAQAIKNSLSRTAKATRRLRAGHRVALTGTPVENRLSELWSIMSFLNPGMLGSADHFRARYAIPVERHGSTDAAQRLRTVTQPYILRRLKTDPTIIDDLPEKIEVKEYCRLTIEQASLYQSIVDDMMDRIEGSTGIERRGNVLAAMTKLKQVCNHPAQVLHDHSPVGVRSGKVIRLEEILEEILAEGDRVLCFTQFTAFAELLLPHLSARFATDVAYLHGGTSKQRRDELVQSFQSGQGPAIFLLSLKAGGTGLNLTAANHVIHLDRWWNPAVENQATDRAFRIGQQRRVQVRKFVCTGTLEERIDEMIEDKQALADLVVGDGEGWLTELSTRELRRLFALSTEAVGE